GAGVLEHGVIFADSQDALVLDGDGFGYREFHIDRQHLCIVDDEIGDFPFFVTGGGDFVEEGGKKSDGEGIILFHGSASGDTPRVRCAHLRAWEDPFNTSFHECGPDAKKKISANKPRPWSPGSCRCPSPRGFLGWEAD